MSGTEIPSNSSNADSIYDAFRLGWSILELKGRILFAADQYLLRNSSPTSAITDDSSTTRDSITRGSVEAVSGEPTSFYGISSSRDSIPFPRVWRTLFNRIVSLHQKSLSDSSTASTMYDIPTSGNDEAFYQILYPGSPDYANFGLNTISDTSFVAQFKLYDVTRRALNCLILAYTRSQDSLIPTTVQKHQNRLTEKLIAENKLLSDDKQATIKFLSPLTVSFLTAWEDYLREKIYLDGKSIDKEIMLIAYEAGHALASLRWNISLLTLPEEYADDASAASPLEAEKIALRDNPQSNEQIKKNIYNVWKNMFNNDNIKFIQQQISALSSPLNDAYYPNQTDRESAQSNFDLPSRTINAINDSLNYWQQVLQWIGNDTESMSVKDISRQFQYALTQQLDVWQSLLLRRQKLTFFTNKKVTEAINNNFLRDFDDAVNAKLQDTINDNKQKLVRRSTIIYIIIGLGVLLLIGLLVPLPWLKDKTLLSIVIGVLTVLFGSIDKLIDLVNKIISYFKKPDTKVSTDRFSDAFGLSHTEVTSAFANGDEHILVKYDHLNYSVGISYPLVEFVTKVFPKQAITNEYDFLAEIIWRRSNSEEEIKREVRTFFGSVGAFVGTRKMTTTTDLALKSLSE